MPSFFRAFLSAVRKILFDWAIKKKPEEKIERGGMEAGACWFELTGRGFFLWAWSCIRWVQKPMVNKGLYFFAPCYSSSLSVEIRVWLGACS